MLRTAVVLHIFYEDIGVEILKEVGSINAEFDLFVTAPLELSRQIRERLENSGRSIEIISCSNQGQDIAPFLTIVPLLIDKRYGAVCKLHTKRGRLDDGETWRSVANHAVLGRRFKESQDLFRSEDAVALIGSRELYMSAKAHMYENRSKVEEIVQSAYPGRKIVADWGFFAGSVFWLRPELFAPLARCAASMRFETERIAKDGQLAHAFERVFGLVPVLNGMSIGLVPVSDASPIEVVAAPGKPSSESASQALRRLSTPARPLPNFASIFERENPLVHYIRYGERTGFKPNPIFDPTWYLRQNPDVRASRMSPLQHFMRHGEKERRDPSANFSSAYYLKAYEDVRRSGMPPVRHYLQHGRHEGRHGTARFEGWKTHVPQLDLLETESCVSPEELPVGYLERSRKILADRPLKFSVVMATWNRAAVMPAAIESLLKQSYAPHEIIVVDDGSEDDTEAVVRTRFATAIKDRRLGYVRIAHKGVSAARNVGLSRATGDIIGYLDSDNKWHEHYALVMCSIFAQQAAISTAYCGVNVHFTDSAAATQLATPYDRRSLLTENYIDLNSFVHRRRLYDQHGGFDEVMTRMVDWELILRYTKYQPPVFVPVFLVEYYLNRKTLKNITYTVDGESNYQRVKTKHQRERIAHDVDLMRIGYVLWDFPALSQTFVINELRWLVTNGYDVAVYFKTKPDLAGELDFQISATQVENADELAKLILRDKRNVLHAHFAYPATTELAWPAARKAGIPFSFMAHAIDITHRKNQKRNRVGEVASDPLCIAVVTLGTYHRRLLLHAGVPSEKLIIERQAVSLPEFREERQAPEQKRARAISIGRFVEKKGFAYLIEAAASLPEIDIVIYGFGPREEQLRRQIEDLGVANVKLGGVLEGDGAVYHAYEEADLFVLPCVEDSDGDMDGLPTVFLEAMAAGVPVVTTDVSNIPDLIIDGVTGFLVKQKDITGLAETIRKVLRSRGSPAEARLLTTARDYAHRYANSERLMSTLTSTWRGRTVDIVLVTYDTPKFDDSETTFEIIERIFRHTTMPFNLIVVDNNSQESFRQALLERFGSRKNFVFVSLEENAFVGPATNIGVSLGQSEYAIYVCSKEGFVLQNGWERRMVEVMDANPKAAMGGYCITVPTCLTGADYAAQPNFDQWRNQFFARQEPDRVFSHVQGGLLIIRRAAYDKVGGFSLKVPQDRTDMEYSYYLESCGYELVSIPDIYAISAKTRPAIHSLLDEHALAVHPLTVESARRYDRLANAAVRHCNLCDWQGEDFLRTSTGASCPACGSSPFERSTFRYLSLSGVLQRRPNITCIGSCEALRRALGGLCPQVTLIKSPEPGEVLSDLEAALSPRSSILIVDHIRGPQVDVARAANMLARYIADGGRCVVAESIEGNLVSRDTLLDSLGNERVPMDEITYVSGCVNYDPLRIACLGFGRSSEEPSLLYRSLEPAT